MSHPISQLSFLDGTTRDVLEGERGRYVVNDAGWRVDGVGLPVDGTDAPVVVDARERRRATGGA